MISTRAMAEAYDSVASPDLVAPLRRLLRLVPTDTSLALQSPAALNDPLAAARRRGREAQRRLLEAEGGTILRDRVADLLGISIQAVDERRQAGRLLALPVGPDDYAYPAWQFAQGEPLPGLAEVLADLDVRDPWMRAAFFLNRNLYLDGARPLALLRSGQLEAVRRAARVHGEQGAA